MISVLDNFYDDPKRIVDMLTGDYPITGCGTGNRSISLDQIDRDLYNQFCDKIFSIHNINPAGLGIITFFMEHEYNPIEVFNKKWIHIDGKNPNVCMMTMDEYRLVHCGQIFLTENPDPDAGVKICEVKETVKWTEKELIDNTINFYTLPREKYNAGLITLEEFTKQHTEYHDNFDLMCEVKNKFNRMVSWKAGTLHGDPMTKKMKKRLTQYFFIEKI